LGCRAKRLYVYMVQKARSSRRTWGDWSRLQQDRPIRNRKTSARYYLLPSQHTRTPLHPAALASVPYGIVLVRVRVRPRQSDAIQPHTDNHSGPPRRLLAYHRLSASCSLFSCDFPRRGGAKRAFRAAPSRAELPATGPVPQANLEGGSSGTASAPPTTGPVSQANPEGGPSGTASSSPANVPVPQANLEGGSRGKCSKAGSTLHARRRAARAGCARQRATPRVWPSSP